MSEVILCVSASDTWTGRLIRWVAKKPVNHAFFIYTSVLWRGWWAVQTDERGVRKLPARRVIDSSGSVKFYKCKHPLIRGIQESRDYIGAAYDFKGVLWGLVRILVSRYFGIKLKGWHSLSNLFCSEICAEVIKKSETPGAMEWVTADVAPWDLDEFYISSPIFTETNDPTLDDRGAESGG